MNPEKNRFSSTVAAAADAVRRHPALWSAWALVFAAVADCVVYTNIHGGLLFCSTERVHGANIDRAFGIALAGAVAGAVVIPFVRKRRRALGLVLLLSASALGAAMTFVAFDSALYAGTNNCGLFDVTQTTVHERLYYLFAVWGAPFALLSWLAVPMPFPRRPESVGRPTRRLVGLLSVVGALVVTGLAGAANGGAFSDRSGDATLTPDITSVQVSNDDSGTLTVQMAFGDDAVTPGLPGEELAVALDLDQNPDTGTVYYGTEVAFGLDFGFTGTTVKFARAGGSEFKASAPPPSLKASFDGGTGIATFTVNRADLGLAPDAGFNLVGISSSIVGDGDLAPDLRTYNYQQVAGHPQPPLGSDKRAPVDHAVASRAVHGQLARLEYSAQDGRAVTADTVRVYRRGRLLRTIRITLGDANPFYTYDARWRVPRTVRGRLRFCVQSVDAAGNKSNLSCARLVVR